MHLTGRGVYLILTVASHAGYSAAHDEWLDTEADAHRINAAATGLGIVLCRRIGAGHDTRGFFGVNSVCWSAEYCGRNCAVKGLILAGGPFRVQVCRMCRLRS